jgi:hypothetical protein
MLALYTEGNGVADKKDWQRARACYTVRAVPGAVKRP